jgi:hypothetical protein
MSRPTDIAIIAEYRQASTDLLECLHASVEMLNRIGQVIPMGAAQQAFDIGMDDLQAQLWGVGDRLKAIHAAQAENVRVSMHWGSDD